MYLAQRGAHRVRLRGDESSGQTRLFSAARLCEAQRFGRLQRVWKVCSGRLIAVMV